MIGSASSTPFFFDLSTFDLYAVLGRGASLHFLPSALNMAPARLSAWLKEHVYQRLVHRPLPC